MFRAALPIALLFALAACSGAPKPTAKAPPQNTELKLPSPQTATPRQTAKPRAQPALYSPGSPLQCVPFAREAAGIEIYGDAWTWWDSAAGRYSRGSKPRMGSVVQLKVNHAERGHLAYVSEVVSSREIIVDHANWLNRGKIHRNTPMVDVSPNNDWSQVRVWYTPGGHLGGSTYPVVGFIYPHEEQRTASLRQ